MFKALKLVFFTSLVISSSFGNAQSDPHGESTVATGIVTEATNVQLAIPETAPLPPMISETLGTESQLLDLPSAIMDTQTVPGTELQSIEKQTTQIKIVSLNGWFKNIVRVQSRGRGVQDDLSNIWISADIRSRAQLQLEALVGISPDIIFMQEIYSIHSSDVRDFFIGELAKKGFIHHVYTDDSSYTLSSLFSGKYGNGLLILSKYPLDNSFVKDFALEKDLDGYAHAIQTKVNLPKIGWVDLFNVSIKDDDNFSELDIMCQKEEIDLLKEWVRLNKSEDTPVIVASSYRSQELDFGLEDTLQKLNPGVVHVTREPFINPYTAGTSPTLNDKIYVTESENLMAIRAEIIFNKKLDAVSTKNRFKNEIPFLSDHYGVLTTFEIR